MEDKIKLIVKWSDRDTESWKDSYCFLCNYDAVCKNYNDMKRDFEMFFPVYHFTGFSSVDDDPISDNKIIFYGTTKEIYSSVMRKTIDDEIKRIEKKFEKCDEDIQKYIQSQIKKTTDTFLNKKLDSYF